MEKAVSHIIENENVFRALVSVPPAILFILLAANSLMSGGIVLFQVIYILLALYFLLSAIGYAALYSNELVEQKTKPLFKNINLSNAISYLALAAIFITTSIVSITSSAHIIFTSLAVLLALITTLNTLAYAAYYTNDRYAKV